MPLLMSCRTLSKSFGARPLFNELTLGVSTGERLGLIGPNGSGKTTLLRILAGEESADSGDISRKNHLRLAIVPQNDDLPPESTIQSLFEDACAADNLEHHERSALLNKTITALGFQDTSIPVSNLSGGWRKRVSIGCALIRQPDLMLLDEPTNHLDLEGVLWLEDLLKASRFASILISHDRWFLERVTTRIIELNRAYPDGCMSIEGNYSEFLVKKEAFLEAQSNLQHALEGKVKREVEWLRRGPQARATKAQYRIDAAHRLIGELADVKQRNSQDREATVDFTSSKRKTKELLKARGLQKSLGGKPLFTTLDIDLLPGTKLGIVGPNGSGKSTLLRVLTGELQPDSGTVTKATGLRAACFDQHRTPPVPTIPLRHALSPESDYITYRGEKIHIVGWARRLLFDAQQLDMPIGALSGGEQARVLIAGIMTSPVDLLILDEPTNDLDIPTLEVLEDALDEFPGAIILVTHDRYLLDSVCTEILSLDGVGGCSYYADYSQWERKYRSTAATTSPAQAERKQAAAVRRLSTAEQRELAGMEDAILRAEAEAARCAQVMTEPDLAADHTKMDAAWKTLQLAEAKTAALYARWEELENRKSGT